MIAVLLLSCRSVPRYDCIKCLICDSCFAVIPFQVISCYAVALLHVVGVIAVIAVVSVLLFHALTVILFQVFSCYIWSAVSTVILFHE